MKTSASPLDSNTDGTMPKIGYCRLFYWIKSAIDNAVKIQSHNLDDLVETNIVEATGPRDKRRECNGRQIAHRRLVERRKLHDLGAEIRRPNDSQMTLVVLPYNEIHVRMSAEIVKYRQYLLFIASLYSMNGPPVSI